MNLTTAALALLGEKLNGTISNLIHKTYQVWCPSGANSFVARCEQMFWCLTGNYFTPGMNSLPCSTVDSGHARITQGDPRYPFAGDAYDAPYAQCSCRGCPKDKP